MGLLTKTAKEGIITVVRVVDVVVSVVTVVVPI